VTHVLRNLLHRHSSGVWRCSWPALPVVKRRIALKSPQHLRLAAWRPLAKFTVAYLRRGNSIGPAPKPPNNWATMKWIVADPLGGSTMTTTRFPTLLVLPATLWLGVSLVEKDCSITRPGGVKEPGVTNTRGECCSSFYSNSGNWDDCVPPTPGRADGARFYTSVSKH